MIDPATSSYDRRVQWLAGVGHAVSHGWALTFPAVAIPMARELDLPFEETVRYSVVLYLMFGLGAPLAGWLTDRVGGRRVLLACLLGGGMSGIGVALSPSATWMVITLGCLGLAASLYHPAGLTLLSLHFSKQQGRAFGINGMAGNVGIAATPFVAGLLTSLVGWRLTYVAICGPSLLFGLFFLFWRFPDQGTTARTRRMEQENERIDWRPLAVLALTVTLGGLAYRMHTLVVPALLGERLPSLTSWANNLHVPGLEHMDNLAATLIASFAYAMGIFGQWLGGRVADRHALVPSYLVFHLVSLPLALCAAALSGPLLPTVVFAYLCFAMGMQPIENKLIAALTPAAWRGRSFAGKFVLSFGIGALASYLVGWVSPYGGLGASFTAVGLLEGLMVGCISLLWWLRRA